MKNYEIYVRSSGFLQEQGYRWFNSNHEIVDEPQMVEKVSHLIESESPSIVLARSTNKALQFENQDKLLLLVTGIKSERRDFRNRIIRISVAWIYENSEVNERLLRAIASEFLTEYKDNVSISNKIDSYLQKHENEHGFQINFNDLEISKLAKKNTILLEEKNNPRISRENNLENSLDNRNKLAKELQNYFLPTNLESKNGALVVVTGIKSPAAFEQEGVWRGLSSSVGKTQSDQSDQRKNHNTSIFFNLSSSKRVFMFCCIISILVVTTGVFLKPAIDARKMQPLESQIQELKLDKIKKQDEYKQLEKQKQEVNNRLNNLNLSIKNIDSQLEKQSALLSKMKNNENLLSWFKSTFHVLFLNNNL